MYAGVDPILGDRFYHGHILAEVPERKVYMEMETSFGPDLGYMEMETSFGPDQAYMPPLTRGNSLPQLNEALQQQKLARGVSEGGVPVNQSVIKRVRAVSAEAPPRPRSDSKPRQRYHQPKHNDRYKGLKGSMGSLGSLGKLNEVSPEEFRHLERFMSVEHESTI